MTWHPFFIQPKLEFSSTKCRHNRRQMSKFSSTGRYGVYPRLLRTRRKLVFLPQRSAFFKEISTQ